MRSSKWQVLQIPVARLTTKKDAQQATKSPNIVPTTLIAFRSVLTPVNVAVDEDTAGPGIKPVDEMDDSKELPVPPIPSRRENRNRTRLTADGDGGDDETTASAGDA
jgi:hypothetical protein